jgi:hypothetical protein
MVSHYVVDNLIVFGGIIGTLGLLYGACATWNKPTQMLLRQLLVGVATGVVVALYILGFIALNSYNPADWLKMVAVVIGFMYGFIIGCWLAYETPMVRQSWRGGRVPQNWFRRFIMRGLAVYFVPLGVLYAVIWYFGYANVAVFTILVYQVIILTVLCLLGLSACFYLSIVALRFSERHFIIISVGFGTFSIIFSVFLLPVLDLLNVKVV